MPKRTQSYNAWQMDRLSHPNAAMSFLNAALADSQELFLVALRKVAQAREMAAVAKEAGIQRETLYHALSEEGNPTLTTFTSILTALGLTMRISTPGALEAPTPSPTRPPEGIGPEAPSIPSFKEVGRLGKFGTSFKYSTVNVTPDAKSAGVITTTPIPPKPRPQPRMIIIPGYEPESQVA